MAYLYKRDDWVPFSIVGTGLLYILLILMTIAPTNQNATDATALSNILVINVSATTAHHNP